MLPAHIAVCIYIMTGKADAPTTAPQAAGEAGSAPAPALPAPVLSPSSDETTEAAMEESAPAPSSPHADEEMPPVSAAVPAEAESGSGASFPPPDAWAAILSFLDRPQEARQSALASLPSSDLIRLCMEASATALGRLSWYDGAGTAAVSGHPIRNPPPGQLVLRAHPVAKEPPPKAMAPSPAKATVEVKAEISDAAPTPPPDNAQPAATPKSCPIPYPGTGNGAASSGTAPEPGQPGPSDDPGPVSAPSETTRPKARQPDPVPRTAPEVVPDDSDDDSLWEDAWYGQLDPGRMAPNQYSWIDVRPPLPPLLRNPPWSSREGWCIDIRLSTTPGTIHRPEWWPFPDLFCLSCGEHPRWLERQEPAAPLSHLRLRGFCTHSCSRLLSRTQGNRCLGLCLRPIMAGERAGHTQHVCHNCLTGR